MSEPKKREPRVKSGIHEGLESEANALLWESLKDVTSREAKSDILTPWKEKNRKSKEIYSKTGHPIDGALRRGNYWRAYNPVQTHLNSYDGTGSRPIKLNSSWDDENGDQSPFNPSYYQGIFGVERDE